MATNSFRGVLRSLPALFALFLALLGGPSTGEQATGSGPAPTVTSSVAASTPDTPAVPATITTPDAPATAPASSSPVAGLTRVLAAQRTAGAASSRAPPAAIA